MRTTKLLVAVCLLALVACWPRSGAAETGYIPLQATHWGNWFNPDAAGEGMELSVIRGDVVLVFANVYLLHEGVPIWLSAAGESVPAWDGSAYNFVAFQRTEVNGEPYEVGTLRLRPTAWGALDWVLTADFGLGFSILRQGALTQLTRPITEPLGRCGPWNFAPAPPPADPIYCD
jgi:hypothetical protein